VVGERTNKRQTLRLSLEQIKTFYAKPDLNSIIKSLIRKGYLQVKDGKFNPVCGNMSFEIFKFLDPDSISITLASSDANRLGVVQNNAPRHLTPRECARLMGFPDSFKIPVSDTQAYKQFGNSIVVPVIEKIAEAMVECLFKGKRLNPTVRLIELM